MQLPEIRICLTRYQSEICRFKWAFWPQNQYAYVRLPFVTDCGTPLHSEMTQTSPAQQA